MNNSKEIDCQEALKRLLEYLDRELDARQSEEMEQHLSTCRSCYSRLEFEKRLQSRLQEAGRQDVPESLRGRINKLFADGNGD